MADDVQEKRPYEETVKSAGLFEDIEESKAKQASAPGADLESLADEIESGLPGEEGPSPLPRESGETPALQPSEPSIGELFSKLVKMAPKEKVRIEDHSIGSLFKKYFTKRG
jgi:hypothetical protein